MTREELKRHCLKQVENCEIWARYNGEEPHGKVYEEHKLILELLEQEPCEDAISRQAAIDAIAKIHPIDMEYDCTLYDKLDVMYVLKDLPPVTPQSKMGHWIRSWYEWQQYLECSKCGYETGLRCDTNYCPNCGARMTEREE